MSNQHGPIKEHQQKDPRLERYLTSLERALQPFPVSDRAEIITEIKSHVLSALERDPETRLDTVLTALGEPETVANRYLLERGMKPTKTSISPIVKWLVIGFLGTLAMLLLFTGFLFSQVTSLVMIDGENEKVEVLGGLISIDGKKNQVSISGVSKATTFAGSRELTQQSLTLKFDSGKVEVEASDDMKFSWGCKGIGAKAPELESSADGAMFDLSQLNYIKCTFSVPEGIRLNINGSSGKIYFNSPRFDIDASLGSGKIRFQKDENTAYKFDMNVGTGKLDKFESSTQIDARSIKIHVGEGAITSKN